MKYITILFLIIAFNSNAQDTLHWPQKAYVNGLLEIDYPLVCVKYDSTLNVSHIYHEYGHPMWLSLNGSQAIRLRRKQPYDVKGQHFNLVVTRKNYSQKYQF